jgi:hypothetical protein
MTLLKAIRAKCLECAGNFIAVGKCGDFGCSLFPYRLGHDPARRGIGGGLNNFKRKGVHSSAEFSEKKSIVETNANPILQERWK